MRHLLTALALITASLLPLRAGAAGIELLMLDSNHCEWCALWDEQIGGIYDRTSEGRCAPLRRMSIFAPVPDDLSLAKPARYTPTFVLLDDGTEIGRIEGYPGEDFFWPMLGQLIARTDAACAGG